MLGGIGSPGGPVNRWSSADRRAAARADGRLAAGWQPARQRRPEPALRRPAPGGLRLNAALKHLTQTYVADGHRWLLARPATGACSRAHGKPKSSLAATAAQRASQRWPGCAAGNPRISLNQPWSLPSTFDATRITFAAPAPDEADAAGAGDHAAAETDDSTAFPYGCGAEGSTTASAAPSLQRLTLLADERQRNSVSTCRWPAAWRPAACAIHDH